MKLIKTKNKILAKSEDGHAFDVTNMVTWWRCSFCGYGIRDEVGRVFQKKCKCPRCKESLPLEWCTTDD